MPFLKKNLFCEWIIDWLPCIQAGMCACTLCYSSPSSWGIFSQFSEGKLINLNLSRASRPSLLLCWRKSVMKWVETKELHRVLVPIMGSGSGDQQDFGKRPPLFENLSTAHSSCIKVFYKMSCWEETWRSDLEYFSVIFSLSLSAL